jgi:hypothetical protein
MEADEKILLVVRKHWFILLGHVLAPVLLFFVPITIFLLIGNRLFAFDMIASLPHKGAAVLFFISCLGLVAWMMLFLVWTDYYLDMWTITDRRIIAIDQRGFFRRLIASFRYERLQDINVEINGFIATMLDFGNLHTQTAGHDVDFKIDGVPKPREIKALIMKSTDALAARSYTQPPAAPNPIPHEKTGL